MSEFYFIYAKAIPLGLEIRVQDNEEQKYHGQNILNIKYL
jgi:hypothetical protein